MSKEWTYRVIRAGPKDKPVYRIYGIKYAPDGSPLGHTTEPISPIGDSLEELAFDLAELRASFLEPVLDSKLQGIEGPYVASIDQKPKEPKKVAIGIFDQDKLVDQIAPLYKFIFTQFLVIIGLCVWVMLK